MRRKKLVAIGMSVMLAVSMLAGCGGKSSDTKATEASKGSEGTTAAASGESGDTIKIAAFYNLSGAGAEAGEFSRNGAEMAVEDINNAGGIESLGGAKLELVFGDTQTDVNQAKAVAENTLGGGDISVCIGVASSAMAVPILGVTERLGIGFLLNGTSDTLTQEGYQTVFRFAPTGTNFGETQVDFLKALNTDYNMNITKVGALYENSESGISTTETFRELAEEVGFEWVYEETFTQNSLTDASNLIVKMKDSGVQAISIDAWEQDLKAITEAMNTIDYHPLLIGGGSGVLTPTFAAEMGEAVNGILSTSSGNWDNADSVDPEVSTRYEDRYGTFMPEHAVGAYAAVQVAAAALEAAGSSDPAAVMEALRNISVDTVDGHVSFDEKGDNPDSVTNMIQWQLCDDGKYRTVSVYPASVAGGDLQH